MKKKNKILIICVATTLATFLFWLSSQKAKNDTSLTKNPTPTSSQLKTFQSTMLDFTVQLPIDYLVEEKFTHIELIKGENSIGGDRNDASGLGNLKGFLMDFDEKNQIQNISEIKELKINNYPAVTRVELRGDIYAKFYYIYVDDWVYVFSTKSDSLYTDLDQIVQSFRYTP